MKMGQITAHPLARVRCCKNTSQINSCGSLNICHLGTAAYNDIDKMLEDRVLGAFTRKWRLFQNFKDRHYIGHFCNINYRLRILHNFLKLGQLSRLKQNQTSLVRIFGCNIVSDMIWTHVTMRPSDVHVVGIDWNPAFYEMPRHSVVCRQGLKSL